MMVGSGRRKNVAGPLLIGLIGIVFILAVDAALFFLLPQDGISLRVDYTDVAPDNTVGYVPVIGGDTGYVRLPLFMIAMHEHLHLMGWQEVPAAVFTIGMMLVYGAVFLMAAFYADTRWDLWSKLGIMSSTGNSGYGC